METKVKEKEVKILEHKKVTIKTIVRGRPFYKKGHDGEFMFTGCRERFTLPFVKNTNSFVNIFKPGEQEAFEKALNRPKGDLSLYDRKSPFWAKTWVELTKEDLTLDLSIPTHALQVRILKANKDIVAPDWASRNFKPSYKWAVIDEDTVFDEENKKAADMQKAMGLFFEIKKSQKQMSDVLRLMGNKMPVSYTKDWLETQISKAIAQTEKISGILNIKDFIETASDPQISEKIFVMDAIEAKTIVAFSGEFRDMETNALLGKSMQSVVDHYADPLYQEDKLLIQEKIKRAGK